MGSLNYLLFSVEVTIDKDEFYEIINEKLLNTFQI